MLWEIKVKAIDFISQSESSPEYKYTVFVSSKCTKGPLQSAL